MWRSCISALLFLAILPSAIVAYGQQTSSAASALEQIPLEHCDRLPVVKVSVGKTDMHFLVDTGATTLLNLKSFGGMPTSNVRISSWTGTAATSARQVQIPSLGIGNHKVFDLKLPAIDLSPIGKACGGTIDGLFGIDLMEKMGLKIDFEKQLASFKADSNDVRRVYDEMEAAMHPCTLAFQEGNSKQFEECLDPEIVLYTPRGEFVGKQQVIKYLATEYFKFAPHLSYDASLHEAKIFGDALWYSYDYRIGTPEGQIAGHGMSMCRKTEGRWRILNMHHSRYDPDTKSQP